MHSLRSLQGMEDLGFKTASRNYHQLDYLATTGEIYRGNTARMDLVEGLICPSFLCKRAVKAIYRDGEAFIIFSDDLAGCD